MTFRLRIVLIFSAAECIGSAHAGDNRQQTDARRREYEDEFIQGARAGNKKVVETDWRFEPNVGAVAQQQQDEDREPAQNRPLVVPQVSQTELQQARAEATTERPVSRNFCQKDPVLSKIFSCPDFAQAVFVYRVAHRADAGAKEPVESLVDDPKFPCQGCVNGVQVMTWVRRRILDEKLNPSSQNCIVSTLTKTLNSNTSQVRTHLENFYKERGCGV